MGRMVMSSFFSLLMFACRWFMGLARDIQLHSISFVSLSGINALCEFTT